MPIGMLGAFILLMLLAGVGIIFLAVYLVWLLPLKASATVAQHDGRTVVTLRGRVERDFADALEAAVAALPA